MNTKYKPALPWLEKRFGPITFGKFVRVARHELELTQIEFSKKLGMAPGTLCDIEKGRQHVSVKLAIKIAKIADMSEEMAIRLVFQEQLDRAKIKMKVDVQSA